MNQIESDFAPKVICRHFAAGDFDAVVDIMVKVPLSIARVRSLGMYKAICHEALTHPQPKIGVAEVDGQIAGYTLGIANDFRAYWKGFGWRHPILALSIIAARLRKKETQFDVPEKVQQMLSPEMQESWSDPQLDIFKFVTLAMNPEFQAFGIGPILYDWMAVEMFNQGFKRVDAHFNIWNVPSARMHEKNNWKMKQSNGYVFAVKYSDKSI